MDESWRMKMGVPANSAGSTAIELEDFDDVFGGPPRSLLLRKLSADFSGNDWFYDEIFRPLDPDSSGIVSGQRLPEFMIPGKKGSRSKNKKANKMSRSKSTSSYVMSFDDELHQLNSFGDGNVIGEDDVALSSFTTKLRPINVPSRWTASSTSIIPKNNNKIQDLASFGNECNDFMIQSFNFGHQQIPTSPQTINNNNEHIINNSNHQENVECHEHLLQVEDADVIISSYDNAQISSLVEVNNAKAIDIDEAIAWAKEKFQGWSLNNEGSCIKEHDASFFAS